VRVLVNDDVVLERTIPLRGGLGPKVHAHLAGLAIGRSSEVGVVGAAVILDGDLDAVVTLATSCNLGVLEVVRLLSEAVLVRDVVDGVGEVEGIGGSGVLI
jgi:hypothetical protein